MRGENHDIYLKILHQAGFETSWQATTSAERHVTIALPPPPLWLSLHHLLCTETINPNPAKEIYLNFHLFEVVSRYRDPQLQHVQVGENYAYLFILRSNIFLTTHFVPNNSDLID